MTDTIEAPVHSGFPGRFRNAAEWWHELGDVPFQRILMNPWPGTATQQDVIDLVQRDKRLVELIDGTLVEKPVGAYESLIAATLIHALISFVRPRGLGFVLGEAAMIRTAAGRIRMPDVTFVSVDAVPNRSFPTVPVPQVPPTIAAEVLSDSNTIWEIRQKLLEYFESGCRLAWVIDPVKRNVTVYTKFSTHPDRVLNDTEALDGGEVLPGFTISIEELFKVSIPRN
jgi:Uma2 family endonuclease